MARIGREKPRKTLAWAAAVVAVLAVGWLAGGGAAGSARTGARVKTVLSIETVKAVETIAVGARRPQRDVVARGGRIGHGTNVVRQGRARATRRTTDRR